MNDICSECGNGVEAAEFTFVNEVFCDADCRQRWLVRRGLNMALAEAQTDEQRAFINFLKARDEHIMESQCFPKMGEIQKHMARHLVPHPTTRCADDETISAGAATV